MVCDDEKYFYDTINELYQELGYMQSSESVFVLEGLNKCLCSGQHSRVCS